MRQKKLKLNQIATDQVILSFRTVNPVFVSRYRQAYRYGVDIPLITVDDKNVVTSGNHRYQAMIEAFGKDHEITVYCDKFESERERMEYFYSYPVITKFFCYPPWAFSILAFILKGIWSVVNLRPQKKYTIRPYSPWKSDSDRLRGDWEKVGQSIQKAIQPNK